MKKRRFTIIPAIDIKKGRCVRLWQGDMTKETIYSEKPEEVAVQWEQAGASIIHVVDLDGAVSGEMVNRSTVAKIVDSVTIPVELGGGIRDRRKMDAYFSLGVQRLILGTAACRHPEGLQKLLYGFPGEVYVGIDARDGMVAVEGWKEILPMTALEMVRIARDAGAAGVIYTDISRDGTLEGPNYEAIRKFAQEAGLPVIASGGVSSLADILALSSMASDGVCGVIVGRALYTGQVDLKEALRFSTK